VNRVPVSSSSSHPPQQQSPKDPVKLAVIPVGDHKVRAKLRFDVVTAKVIETAGKKHVVRL
jgi:hypothetical protein